MIAETFKSVALKLVLTELFKQLKKTSSAFAKLKSINVNNAYLKASKVEEVKTIWQVDKNINLNEIYHPSKVLTDDKRIEIESLKGFPENAKLVISGTAGQGKSIFLRYLTGKELREGHSVPLFIELRKISDRQSLEDLIISQLTDLGLPVDSSALEVVYASGKCTLLLDAFDEISDDQVGETISYIESVCTRHNDLRIIISSRPGAAIQHVPIFRILELAPLQPPDFGPMLQKFFPDESGKQKVAEILKAIHGSSSGIANLITTPLLLTLLTITYKSYHRIPEQLHEFYDNLFYLLVNRHDSTKPGFKREFKSGLNENELEQLFCAFCFYCMLEEKDSISHTQAVELVKKAKIITNMENVSENAFLADTKNNTCLIVEEGFEFHFIHKSIKEYHAARFIKNSPLQLKEKFYSRMLTHSSGASQEIAYLINIDPYYCSKLFLIPSYEQLFEETNFDGTSLNIAKEDLLKNIKLTLSGTLIMGISGIHQRVRGRALTIDEPLFRVIVRRSKLNDEQHENPRQPMHPDRVNVSPEEVYGESIRDEAFIEVESFLKKRYKEYSILRDKLQRQEEAINSVTF